MKQIPAERLNGRSERRESVHPTNSRLEIIHRYRHQIRKTIDPKKAVWIFNKQVSIESLSNSNLKTIDSINSLLKNIRINTASTQVPIESEQRSKSSRGLSVSAQKHRKSDRRGLSVISGYIKKVLKLIANPNPNKAIFRSTKMTSLAEMEASTRRGKTNSKLSKLG